MKKEKKIKRSSCGGENNIVISDPTRLEKVQNAISEGGAEHLYVLADFDKTLTKTFVSRENVGSLLAFLPCGARISAEYIRESQAFYDRYRPIENSPDIPLREKKKIILEWWVRHFDLLIKAGLNKRDLRRAIMFSSVEFRKGFNDFADMLKEKSIPLIIISSSGFGEEGIMMHLEKEGRLSENIHIISNTFQWDEKGYATAVNGQIVHILNKNEILIQDYPVFEIAKTRKNALLLGDNLNDVHMAEGFCCENLIKIGFLNKYTRDDLARYARDYDIVMLNDSSMSYVNNLLKEIIGGA